ncbi:hypothetical protein PO124_28675 [Bacillus licheniformis]|nr:hypothetical protein [Bacillus licheniformis]
MEQDDEYEQAIFEAVENILFDKAYKSLIALPIKEKEIDPAIYKDMSEVIHFRMAPPLM